MKEFEYYCFDLDGTLLDSSKRIPVDALQIIHKLKSKNKHIFFASGRHYSEIAEYVKAVGMSDGDFIIACDGQYVFDHNGSRVFGFPMLKKKDAAFIGRYCKGSEMYLSTDGPDYKIMQFGLRYIIQKIKKALIGDGRTIVLSGMKRLNDSIGIEKIRAIKKDWTLDDSVKSKYSVHEDSVQYDIQHKDVNKYRALLVMKEMGLIDELDSLLYFGNDINDIECFEMLKWTVAMADTQPEIAGMASFLTNCRNDENGIAEFFESNEIINKQ